jgi:tetratricopeptide (TPR) repeat protein
MSIVTKVKDCLALLEIAESIAPFEREISIIRARAHAIKKQFTEAHEILEDLRVGATKSDSVDILIAESFIYEHMKDYNAMYDALANAVTIDSKNEEAMERVWISAELSRRYDDSVELHKYIIEKDPYNYQAWYNLGHGYNCIWEYEKALMHLSILLLLTLISKVVIWIVQTLACKSKILREHWKFTSKPTANSDQIMS